MSVFTRDFWLISDKRRSKDFYKLQLSTSAFFGGLVGLGFLTQQLKWDFQKQRHVYLTRKEVYTRGTLGFTIASLGICKWLKWMEES